MFKLKLKHKKDKKSNTKKYLSTTEDQIYSDAVRPLAEFSLKVNNLATQVNSLVAVPDKLRLQSTVDSLNLVYDKIQPLRAVLPKIEKYVSPILEIARETNLTVSKLMHVDNIKSITENQIHQFYKPFKQLTQVTPLQNNIDLGIQSMNIDKLNSIFDTQKISQLTVKANLTKIGELSTFAECSLSKVPWNDIGNKLNLNSEGRNIIQESFLGTSVEYKNLFKAFNEDNKLFANLNPRINRLTPVEFFNNANLIESITIDEKETKEEKFLKNEISIENERELMRLLPQISPDLTHMWKGAIQSIEGSNPDRIRHFSTSFRELTTQVLHILSPNQNVKKIIKEEKYYHNGNPTREGRLMYICREINTDPLKEFVKKDISAHLAFLDLIQKGTHQKKFKLTEEQISALRRKAESTLRYFIEISPKL